jgi:hypothetical protein
MSDHIRNTGPMLASPRCGAKTRCGGACRSPAVHGRRRLEPGFDRAKCQGVSAIQSAAVAKIDCAMPIRLAP